MSADMPAENIFVRELMLFYIIYYMHFSLPILYLYYLMHIFNRFIILSIALSTLWNIYGSDQHITPLSLSHVSASQLYRDRNHFCLYNHCDFSFKFNSDIKHWIIKYGQKIFSTSTTNCLNLDSKQHSVLLLKFCHSPMHPPRTTGFEFIAFFVPMLSQRFLIFFSSVI